MRNLGKGRIILIRLTLILFVYSTLSFGAKPKKYILKFDAQIGTLLNTEQNQLVLHSIKNEYRNEDSISVAVSYSHINIKSQFESKRYAREMKEKLSNILPNTKVKMLERFDKKSFLDGVFFEKRRKKTVRERTLLIKLN